MQRRKFLLSCTAAVIAPVVPLKSAGVMVGHVMTNKITLDSSFISAKDLHLLIARISDEMNAEGKGNTIAELTINPPA